MAKAKSTKTLNTDKAEKDLSEFAKFVIRYRKINGNMSQRDLATKIGMSASAVAFAETDKFDMPIAFFTKLLPHLDDGNRALVYNLFQEAVVNELQKGLNSGTNTKKK